MMERYPWIREHGEITEDKLPELLKQCKPDDVVVACFTHCFRAARGDMLRQILNDNGVDSLLELRVFDAGRELWVHRTVLGEPFSWRVASEEGLTDADFFETRQTLDIDETYKPDGPNAYGARRLRTTGGGAYALPIEEGDDCAVLVNYVAYDENGCAYAADWRLQSFAPQEKLDQNYQLIRKEG